MRLTDDERAMLAWALADHACTHRGTEDDAAITGCSKCQLISERGVWPAVEAILTARLAAVEALHPDGPEAHAMLEQIQAAAPSDNDQETQA